MSWHIFMAQKILPLLFHIILAVFFESIYSSFFFCVKRCIRVWHLQKQQQSHLKLEISDQLVRVYLLFMFSLHHLICLEYRIKNEYNTKKHVVQVNRTTSNQHSNQTRKTSRTALNLTVKRVTAFESPGRVLWFLTICAQLKTKETFTTRMKEVATQQVKCVCACLCMYKYRGR